jgi:glycosyltransferase involved in cell wall biosynthesis
MSPSKRPEILLDALALLRKRNVPFTASFYGSPLPEDVPYYEGLKKRAEEKDLNGAVSFFPGVVNEEAPHIFQAHEIFVNCSRSGMFDKMLFEAAASGCLVISESEDMQTQGFDSLTYCRSSAASLADTIAYVLELRGTERADTIGKLATLVQKNGLKVLREKLLVEMRS